MSFFRCQSFPVSSAFMSLNPRRMTCLRTVKAVHAVKTQCINMRGRATYDHIVPINMAKSCCRYPESKGAATTKPLSHGARKFPH